MGVEHSMRKKFSIFNFQFSNRARAQRGFTLLLAALVGSVVLALGSAVFSIAMKQVTLSSIGKNSQFAFYAADTAAECALFWDFRSDIPTHKYFFATSSGPDLNPLTSITCDQQAAPVTVEPGAMPIAATTTFRYDITGSGGKLYCAKVSVAKVRNSGSSGINTVIYSNGYSSPCASITTARDTLERAVKLRY